MIFRQELKLPVFLLTSVKLLKKKNVLATTVRRYFTSLSSQKLEWQLEMFNRIKTKEKFRGASELENTMQ